jgi:hypothetical protein
MSPADIQLLKACTLTIADAQAAWEEWRETCQIETAGPRSQLMFSMLYAHLISATGGPEESLLNGIHKRTWYANQLLLAQMLPLLEQLKANEVQVLVLNDVALVKGYYADIGYRGIQCIDLLVPAADWKNSLTLASGVGWLEQTEQSFESPGALSITTFKGTERQTLRIWTNLFVAPPQQHTEALIWQGASRMDINGQSALRLGAVEQLLAVGVEACRHAEPPLSIYADAMFLLKSLTLSDDWARLVWQAQRYECILPLRNMLGFLQGTFCATLPSWVLPALHKMAISHFELLQYPEACESLALRFKSACLRLASQFRTGVPGG